ncbi:MAG: hypothetical protein L0H64_12615, partial [Pseudonocardia sp.]|nr:hypothetical protein [Pseudonocardia sp.]
MTGSGTERLEGATRGRPAGLGRIVAAVVVVAATGGFFAAGMAVGAGPGGVAEPHYPHDAISCQLQVVGNETPE